MHRPNLFLSRTLNHVFFGIVNPEEISALHLGVSYVGGASCEFSFSSCFFPPVVASGSGFIFFHDLRTSFTHIC